MLTIGWIGLGFLARRSLLVAILIFAISPCRSEVTLNLAHIYPAEHPTTEALALFSEQVAARSRGMIKVKIFDAASGGNQAAIFQSMRNGSLDISVLSQGVITEVVPEAAAFGLPFLFPDVDSAWRVLNGLVGQKYKDLLAAQGFVALSFWDIEVRHLTNSIRPILKPEDVVDLRIRIPPDPLAAEVISALGGKPRVLNFSDIYPALQQQVVDGQENPVLNVHIMKLYEVQKFLSLTGHKYSVFVLLITKGAWDKLSTAEREIVKTAALEATQLHHSLAVRVETEAYRVIAAHGVRVSRVDPALFVKATAKIYDKWYASRIEDFVRTLVREIGRRP